MRAESETARGVALGGFMGAGKSTIGRALADRLGWPFVDTDSVLAARHGPIRTQLADLGEQAFRAREREVVRELASPGWVIATGGGVFADAELRRALAAHAWTVTLDVDLATVNARIGQDPERPLLARARQLLAQRAEAYSDVDLTVDGRRSVTEVVDAILAWLGVAQDVPVRLDERSYEVLLRSGLAGLGRAVRQATGAERVALVTESTVGPLWASAATESLSAAGVQVHVRVDLPAGEAHKTVSTWGSAVDQLLDAGVQRSTPVVALGGGVLGDIAGFAAASVLRGVPFVQVPTTLLAMVDSSVGGKTGVNHASGKNLVGAFHQPCLVYAALQTLGTLDPRAGRAGLAEIVKAALIADAGLLEHLEAEAPALAALQPGALAEVIPAAIRIKAQIVAEDEREGGRRAVLNLGHTLGHAVETVAGHGVVHHGEAVAIGLVAEARWAAAAGLGPPDLPGRLQALLARLGLPTQAPPLPADRLLAAVGLDKKRTGAMLRQPVCVRPGQVCLVQIPLADAAELVAHLTVMPA